MMPSLVASDLGAPAGSVNVPPPRFRPLGHVTHPTLQSRDYVRSRGLTVAQENGLRYEAHVQAALLDRFPTYMAGPQLSFLDNRKHRVLYPDGLCVEEDRVFIFEIKHQHCPEAWWQLEKLYKGVIEKLFLCPISLVEICRSYDPAMPFPCPVALISNLDTWVTRPRDEFGVFVWRKPTP